VFKHSLIRLWYFTQHMGVFIFICDHRKIMSAEFRWDLQYIFVVHVHRDIISMLSSDDTLLAPAVTKGVGSGVMRMGSVRPCVRASVHPCARASVRML
jgi:hypothetical protein